MKMDEEFEIRFKKQKQMGMVSLVPTKGHFPSNRKDILFENMAKLYHILKLESYPGLCISELVSRLSLSEADILEPLGQLVFIELVESSYLGKGGRGTYFFYPYGSPRHLKNDVPTIYDSDYELNKTIQRLFVTINYLKAAGAKRSTGDGRKEQHEG